MIDILGYRVKLGLVVPSLNTVVAADAFQISLTGVTVHFSDIFVPDDDLAPTGRFSDHCTLDSAQVSSAFARMATRSPHGTSVLLDEDFFSNRGNWLAEVIAASGLAAVTTPTAAMAAALSRMGLNKVALLAPYAPEDSAIAAVRLETMGCNVVRSASMNVVSQGASAHSTFLALRKHFESLIGDDIDGVVQLGHNLPLGRLVDNLEEDFGKPILAINQVCLWHMLRSLGVNDVVPGQGRLLLDF